MKKVGLPTVYNGDTDRACAAMLHDKKAADGYINVITVSEIGRYAEEKFTADELIKKVKQTWR